MIKLLRKLLYIRWFNFNFSLREIELDLISFPYTKDLYLFALQLRLPLCNNAFNFKLCLFANEIELSYWRKEWHLFYTRFGTIIKCIPKYEKEKL